LVPEDVGSPDEVIAALLHDVLEDQDPDKTRGLHIEQAFGPRVLGIVQGCPGPKSEEIPDYRERKQRYLDHLVAEPPSFVARHADMCGCCGHRPDDHPRRSLRFAFPGVSDRPCQPSPEQHIAVSGGPATRGQCTVGGPEGGVASH
jgi:hypothetical protein